MAAPMPLAECRIIEFQRFDDARGTLTVVEAVRHCPFPIARVFWVQDVPHGASRAGHAHRELYQLLIAASGSFDITLDDGQNKRRYRLDRSDRGLLIAPMVWEDMGNFSANATALVFASASYDESDYIREYRDFIELARR